MRRSQVLTLQEIEMTAGLAVEMAFLFGALMVFTFPIGHRAEWVWV